MSDGSRRRWQAITCVHNGGCRRCGTATAVATTCKIMSEHSLDVQPMKVGGSLRGSLARAADVLVAAVAVVLPWSTSATAILIVLWLIALVPTLDAAAVRRELLSAAGGLPVLLWFLGAIGMLWADVSWSERAAGLSGFHKLLVIPLLLAQFRRSGQAQWALLGFLASSATLLLVSWGLVLVPGLTWRGKTSPGVPVRDYILQSAIFAVCAFGLLAQATELWRARKPLALALRRGGGAVSRKHRLCRDRSHDARRHVRAAVVVRVAEVSVEGRVLGVSRGRSAGWRGVGVLALPARARIACPRAGIEPWYRQHAHRSGTAPRILEKVERIDRGSATGRAWNRHDSDAVPTRRAPCKPPHADHHQSAQPGPDNRDSTGSRRGDRAGRHVDFPFEFCFALARWSRGSDW